MSAGARRASHTANMIGEARRSLHARRALLSTGAPTPHAREELAEIDAALARLDDGSWGRCERCGGAIGRHRLRALPEARRCVTCPRP